MPTYKVKYATRNKLARALQMEIKKLGLIDYGTMYDSVRISAMTGTELNRIDITVSVMYYYFFLWLYFHNLNNHMTLYCPSLTHLV